MNDEFLVDTDVTIPVNTGIPIPGKRCDQRQYPFRKLEVGDSFFVEATMIKMSGPMSYWKQKLGRRFECRAWEEDGVVGVRIWRTL